MAGAAKEAGKPAWLAGEQSSNSRRGSSLPGHAPAMSTADAAADLMASLNSTLSGTGDTARHARTSSTVSAAVRTNRTDAAADLLADLNSTLSGSASAPKRPALSSIAPGVVAAPRRSKTDTAADLLADLNSTLSGAVEGPKRAASSSIFTPAGGPRSPATARRSSQNHAPAAAASPRTSMLAPASARSSVSTGGSELAQIEATLQQDRRVSALPAPPDPNMRRTAEVRAGADELAQISAMMQQERKTSAVPQAPFRSARPTTEPEPSRGSRSLAADNGQRAASIGGAELAAISAVLQHETERRVSAALQPGSRQASPRSTGSVGGGELARFSAMLQQEHRAATQAPAPVAPKSTGVAGAPTMPPLGLDSLLADAAEAASVSRQLAGPAKQQSPSASMQMPDPGVHARQSPTAVDPATKGPRPSSAVQSRQGSVSVQPHQAVTAHHAPPRIRQTQYAYMLQPEFISPPSLIRMQAKLQQDPQLPPDLTITAQLG